MIDYPEALFSEAQPVTMLRTHFLEGHRDAGSGSVLWALINSREFLFNH